MSLILQSLCERATRERQGARSHKLSCVQKPSLPRRFLPESKEYDLSCWVLWIIFGGVAEHMDFTMNDDRTY